MNTHSLSRYSSSPVSEGKVISFFTYATNDAKAAVAAAGYFNNARSELSVGDVITASTDLGGTVTVSTLKVDTVPPTGNVVVSEA